jgi:precorrin-6B methylase 2
VLAETFAAGVEWAKRTGRAAEWTEVSFSRSRPTGTGTRLAAENPVTLLKLREEDGK